MEREQRQQQTCGISWPRKQLGRAVPFKTSVRTWLAGEDYFVSEEARNT